MNILKRKTIFDIIKEAEEDNNDAAEQNNQDSQDAAPDDGTDDAPAPEESGEDASSDGGDEFDIDASLDGDGGDDNGSGGDDSSSSADTSLDSGSDGESNDREQAVQVNTDIFSSLTAEEQKIKISELKKMYLDLYVSVEEFIHRINSLNINDNDIEMFDRITTILYTLKDHIKTYILNIFSQKTYIENDINFNRFLSILNSVNMVLNDYSKKLDN